MFHPHTVIFNFSSLPRLVCSRNTLKQKGMIAFFDAQNVVEIMPF